MQAFERQLVRFQCQFYILAAALFQGALADDDPVYGPVTLAQAVKFDLWQRGEDFPCGLNGCSLEEDSFATLGAKWLLSRNAPVQRLRGGADGCSATTASCDPVTTPDLDALRAELGPEFSAALEKNEMDHEADCAASCASFYCGDANAASPTGDAAPEVPHVAHPMGSVPPEDFVKEFSFPLDLIKVTSQPMIPPSECEDVVRTALAEEMANNEYTSGKYKLGGDWVKKMPRTLEWFNRRLKDSIFPTVASFFPMVVKGPQVLRAHSVAILKYNSSHPRTDIHVDDGILALTLALSPRANYTGGGTFFEHLGEDRILEMEQGFCTIRPGSVRHGGHPVTGGDRFILGAFLLIADRIEHVRRLNNQGREARRLGDLRKARLLFKWALKINPRCATCLKNWGESLTATPDDTAPSPKLAAAAEDKIRRALELLPHDSDALFSLGVLLSGQGRSDEAMEAYRQSLAINKDDYELCYNLGNQYGAKGQYDREIEMYKMALTIKEDFGSAWANLGVAYASTGRIAEAEQPFRKAVEYQPEKKINWINLARFHQATGNAAGAKDATAKANACAA